MRKTYSLLLAVGALTLALGCTVESTKSNNDHYTPSPSGSNAYSPPATGIAINEQQACELMVGYLQKTAKRLNCNLAEEKCPDYLRRSNAAACLQWDEGTIKGCEAHFDSFKTCNEISTRGCNIQYIPDSAGKGCTELPDGGLTDSSKPDSELVDTDAEPDGGKEPDANPDGSQQEPDANPDTEPDGSQQEPDANPDTEPDGSQQEPDN